MRYYEITPESTAYSAATKFWEANAPKIWEKDGIDDETIELLGGLGNTLAFLNLLYGDRKIHPPMYGRYYMTANHPKDNLRNMKGLIEVPEADFLRLRADWIKLN